jgi:hypothetical protein
LEPCIAPVVGGAGLGPPPLTVTFDPFQGIYMHNAITTRHDLYHTVFNLKRLTHVRHYAAPYVNESAAGKGLELRKNRHVWITQRELRRETTRDDLNSFGRSGRE